MIGTGQQIELTYRRPHQTLILVLQSAKLPHLPDAHIDVADDVRLGIFKALLNIACYLHTLANGLAGFTQTVSSQFLVVHTRNLDVGVNVVQHGAEDALLVFGYSRRRTCAWLLAVSKIPLGALKQRATAKEHPDCEGSFAVYIKYPSG
jgi:hypothetical protein